MRSFLILTIVVSVFSCGKQKEVLVSSDNFKLVNLGEGLYSCIHKFGGKAICNVGIIDNGTETIIFDSFLSPGVATELLSIVEDLNLSPIKFVVNSHSHNDHIRGNQVFPKEVKIISTTKTKELIEKWEPLDIAEEKIYAPARFAYYDSIDQSFIGDKTSREYQQILMWKPYYEILTESHLEIETRLPDIFVDSVRHFDGPGRRVILISKGAGHTESDLIMYLPDDHVVFTGDLVFNACHPYVPHGNIAQWKKWLDFINSLNPEIVIPGHGDIGTNEITDQMKNYLIDLESTALDILNKNHTTDDLDSILPPDLYKEWWFDRFYSSNLLFAYESVTVSE